MKHGSRHERRPRKDFFISVQDSVTGKLARLISQNDNRYDGRIDGKLMHKRGLIGKARKKLDGVGENRRLNPEKIKMQALDQIIELNGGVIPDGIAVEHEDTMELLKAVEDASYIFIRGGYIFDNLVEDKMQVERSVIETQIRRKIGDIEKEKRDNILNMDRIKLMVIDDACRISEGNPGIHGSIPDDVQEERKALQTIVRELDNE